MEILQPLNMLHARLLSWVDECPDPSVPKSRLKQLITELIQDFEQWREIEKKRDQLQFRIADKVLELERLSGESAYQFLSALASYYHYNPDTLRRVLYVAQLFPPEIRKLDLPFSYYRRIAESYLGTRDWMERQARAAFLLEVVYDFYQRGESISSWEDFRQLVQLVCEEQGWLPKKSEVPAPSDTSQVIDVPFIVSDSSDSSIPSSSQVVLDLKVESIPTSWVQLVLRSDSSNELSFVYRSRDAESMKQACESVLTGILSYLYMHGYRLTSWNCSDDLRSVEFDLFWSCFRKEDAQ